MIDEITKLEKLLEKVQKPALSVNKKDLLRRNMIRQIENGNEIPMTHFFTQVSDYVVSASKSLKLPINVRVLMKENVFQAITSGVCRAGFFARNLFVFRRILSGTLVSAILMGFVSFATVDMKVAFADTVTQIRSVSGEVVVTRDGSDMRASEDMKLYEGDKILTKGNGFASIVFLDDSVMRLSSQTALQINRLFADPNDKTSTYVEVKINQGDVWSRVLNLLGVDSAFVVKAGNVEAKTKKAAFNVSVHGNDAALEVYNHIVEVKTPLNDAKITSGERMVANVSSDSGVVKVENTGKENQWVKKNLQDDKVYLAQVSEKKKEGREQAVSDKFLYPFGSIKNGVQKLLTFDDISQEKMGFEDVQRKFVEAEVALENGDLDGDEAKASFDNFVNGVNRFKDLIANVRANGDIEYADELKAYLQGELSKYKKDLSAVLPDSPLYPAKQIVMDAEVAAAESEVEAVAVQTEQASAKLGEASDLVEAGSDKAAVKALNDYAATVSETARKVDNLPETSKQEALKEITSVVDDGKQVSTAIKSATTEYGDAVKVEAAAQAAVSAVSAVATDVKVEETEDALAAKASDAGDADADDKPAAVSAAQKIEYSVPVVQTPDGDKPLDPLLNLNQ